MRLTAEEIEAKSARNRAARKPVAAQGMTYEEILERANALREMIGVSPLTMAEALPIIADELAKTVSSPVAKKEVSPITPDGRQNLEVALKLKNGALTIKKTKNKFGAVKSSEGDSRKEVRRLQELRLLQQAGQISGLIPQVRYGLVPAQRKGDGTIERALTYTCDAQYVENGRLVVEDCKSPPTRALPRYIAARKLMLKLYGIEIREI